MIEYKVQVHYDGTETWHNSKGHLHREGDKPAVVRPDGSKGYYKNGRTHRENGPAEIYANGDFEYYLDGQKLTKEEHERRTQKVLKLTVSEIEEKFGSRVHIIK